MTYPEGDRRFEVCVTCLEQIVDAHCTGGAAAREKGGGDGVGSDAGSPKRVPKPQCGEEKEADLLDKSIEKWARRKEERLNEKPWKR